MAAALGADPDAIARPSDFAQALFDLGATLCTARAPKCLVCPLRDACAAAPIDPAQLAVRARSHAPRKAPQNDLPFERTNRFLRGRIIDRLRDVPARETIGLEALRADHARQAEGFRNQEANIRREKQGLVAQIEKARADHRQAFDAAGIAHTQQTEQLARAHAAQLEAAGVW